MFERSDFSRFFIWAITLIQGFTLIWSSLISRLLVDAKDDSPAAWYEFIIGKYEVLSRTNIINVAINRGFAMMEP